MSRLTISIALAVFGLSTGLAAERAIRQLTADSLLYQDLFPRAQSWREAILRRDINGIEVFTLPEHQAVLRKVLSQSSSSQYRYVFGGWAKSLRSRMARRDRVLLFEEVGRPRGWAPTVTACYVSNSEFAKEWPREVLTLKDMTVTAGIPCQDFVQSDGRWYATLAELYEN